MSFFIKGKQMNGAKRPKFSKVKPKVTHKKNEEITSSEDEDVVDHKIPEPSSSEDEYETAQEKKVRLAKIYLQEIEKEEKTRLEQDEIDRSVISTRLKEDYLREAGKLKLSVADQYEGLDEDNNKILKCRDQRDNITCFCISSDDRYVFSGSKDGVVVKYSLLDNKKVGIIPFVKQRSNEEVIGHSKRILSISISTDFKYLVIGDESSIVYIWDPVTLRFIKKLTGHKSAITGLCFKRDSYTLYSCSKDRTVKVWSLDEMTYVETLFGHQNEVVSVDTLYKDRVVSCGGGDLRVWKITEETQLIFNGHVGNIDNVKMINEENFISGGDDGQICIWSILRKKPLCVIEDSHGTQPSNGQPFWITSVTSVVNSDVVASGSHDGYIRLWKLENNFKSANLLLKIPVEGFVNSLAFTSDGKKLIAAVSRDHKFGRWDTIRSVKNYLRVFSFLKKI